MLHGVEGRGPAVSNPPLGALWAERPGSPAALRVNKYISRQPSTAPPGEAESVVSLQRLSTQSRQEGRLPGCSLRVWSCRSCRLTLFGLLLFTYRQAYAYIYIYICIYIHVWMYLQQRNWQLDAVHPCCTVASLASSGFKLKY